MPGGSLGVGGDNRLGNVVREGVREDGDHGGVDMFEECWTLVVIQWATPSCTVDTDKVVEGEGGWGGTAVGAVCREQLEWAEASLDDS